MASIDSLTKCKTLEDKSRYFLLVILGFNPMSFPPDRVPRVLLSLTKPNAYLHVPILDSFEESVIRESPLYYTYLVEEQLVVLTLKGKVWDDIRYFREGKYSRISPSVVEDIKEFSTLAYNEKSPSLVLLGVVHDVRAKMLIESYYESAIDIEDEYLCKLPKSSKIFIENFLKT